MKYLFIINPVAGKGHAKAYIPEIHNYFINSDVTYHIEQTEYPGHASIIAASYCRDEDYRIIAFGGDGTLNEVINGMAGTNSSVGIIPTGSGNDFIKTLIPDRNYKNILKRTIEGKEKAIDCGKALNKFFINIFSVGIDSEIAHYATQIKNKIKLTGIASYLLGLLVAMIKKKMHFHLKIALDDQPPIEDDYLLVACTNGKFYGGGFMPVPETRFDDGILDVCAIKEKGVAFILKVLPKYMKGTHINFDCVSFYKIKKMTIESEKSFRINIDGEVLIDRFVDVELFEKHIQIICPTHP